MQELGTRVNAESTSRTGLTLTRWAQSRCSRWQWYIVWGAWPLADNENEFGLMNDTVLRKMIMVKMTLARSEREVRQLNEL